MSDERENPIVPDPGAPVEEQAAHDSTVQDAVDRAAAITDEGVSEAAVAAAAAATVDVSGPAGGSVDADAAAAQAHKEAAALVDTEMSVQHPTAAEAAAAAAEPRVAEFVETPSAAAESVVAAPVVDSPVRDGEIRIGADHPMAALYMQTPMPPDLKGNRGAGALIALLATLAFAVLYAGIISLWIAPTYPPSTFLTEGLLPWVTSWGFIAGVAAFYIGLLLLVLVFGRAGWWAYVLFSLLVGVMVWAATTATFVLAGHSWAEAMKLEQDAGSTLGAMRAVAFSVPTLAAAVLAREVAVWFGAWIGARGRKVTAKNAVLLAEYESALAEVRTQQ